jgi:hypothetical protein
VSRADVRAVEPIGDLHHVFPAQPTCAVVSKAEIGQALGVKLTDGMKNPTLQTPGVVSTCDYKTSSGGRVTIAITTTRWAN